MYVLLDVKFVQTFLTKQAGFCPGTLKLPVKFFDHEKEKVKVQLFRIWVKFLWADFIAKRKLITMTCHLGTSLLVTLKT